MREDKISKRAKVIYQSQKSVVRELSGIEKILQAAGLFSKELQNSIFQLNQTFGKYHALEMLNDAGTLTDQCQTPDEETMVNEFLKLWNSTKSPLHQ